MSKFSNLSRFFSILALIIGMTLVTLGTPEVARADSLYDEIQDFHKLLHDHPRIAGQVERNPGLVNDPRFVNDHDDLRQFLRDHPRVRRELSHNPDRIINGSYRRDEDNRRHDEGRHFGWWERR